MNFVDRVFLIIVLAFTVLLLNTGINILDYITIDDFLIIIVVMIIIWEILATAHDGILKYFKGKDEVIIEKKIDLIPIIKEVEDNKKLRIFKSEHIEKEVDRLRK